jgi:hypothetical protein
MTVTKEAEMRAGAKIGELTMRLEVAKFRIVRRRLACGASGRRPQPDFDGVLLMLFHWLGQVDLFVHESLHAYEHMMLECEKACPSGLILADDPLQNSSAPGAVHLVQPLQWNLLRGIYV